MALRWCAGIAEAGNSSRRVNGHMYLPALPNVFNSTSPHRLSVPSVKMRT
jgi:hypothetical protein